MKNLHQLFTEIDGAKARLDALRAGNNFALTHALDIEYTFESNRIEDNTLSLRETGLVIDKGLTSEANPCANTLRRLIITRLS
jgi:hypothetical protein